MSLFWKTFVRPKAWVAKLLLLVLIAAFGTLAYLGYLKPIVAFLDSEDLTYVIGNSRISAYLVLKGLLTVSIGFWLAGWFTDYTDEKIKSLNHVGTRSKAILGKVLQIVIYFILFLIILDILGVDLATLGILGGAIGIGIGFGLQKITSNFISGLILLFENSIEIGDLVELQDGLFGFVRHTSARYTLIETFDGKEVMIPNEDFVTNRVVNWTYTNSNGRVEIAVGVSYNSDLDLVHKLLIEAAKEHPTCMEDPEPVCYVDQFADSSVNFLLYFWVADVTLGRRGPKSDVMRTIWYKFKENGVTIPFPQRDLHMIPPEERK
ncbi:hypothetical protein GCM10017044_04620 [Kordiimonas sediminis]|uniref:Mechanosensitive ion channel protein MscS n=1 Tax=Kordiimonas sediminis TaxID=1735581 RepID=A0A919AM95_9PROT|nr:mechanosensitive ion channel domain-containing protein [Kordiimonas sediminis]GHF13618.1 hypothetical protein GCM10017044_04620 [Kordiimonas sediminis]